MQYLLDTNICIAIIKRKSSEALSRVLACKPGELMISTITVAEMRFGAAKSQSAERAHAALDEFLAPLEQISFDEPAALAYGAIRAELESKGTPIGPLDILLAAQAVAHELILVTNNEREFR